MNNQKVDILDNKYTQEYQNALDIYENTYSHEELIEFLKNGTVAQKQASVLKLDKINSKKEAQIFISNLTGCDGKIREAVSFRLKEFVKQNPEFFTDFYDIFLDAIIDINGNICRNTICSLVYLKEYKNFTVKFTNNLTKNTLKLAAKAKTFDIQDGKYKINKELFKLYWYLETLYEFADYISKNILFEILNTSKDVKDYTIREKTAKILSKLNDNMFDNIKSELALDCNYYVLKQLSQPVFDFL